LPAGIIRIPSQARRLHSLPVYSRPAAFERF